MRVPLLTRPLWNRDGPGPRPVPVAHRRGCHAVAHRAGTAESSLFPPVPPSSSGRRTSADFPWHTEAEPAPPPFADFAPFCSSPELPNRGAEKLTRSPRPGIRHGIGYHGLKPTATISHPPRLIPSPPPAPSSILHPSIFIRSPAAPSPPSRVFPSPRFASVFSVPRSLPRSNGSHSHSPAPAPPMPTRRTLHPQQNRPDPRAHGQKNQNQTRKSHPTLQLSRNLAPNFPQLRTNSVTIHSPQVENLPVTYPAAPPRAPRQSLRTAGALRFDSGSPAGQWQILT